jgi:hypothetical protein
MDEHDRIARAVIAVVDLDVFAVLGSDSEE